MNYVKVGWDNLKAPVNGGDLVDFKESYAILGVNTEIPVQMTIFDVK